MLNVNAFSLWKAASHGHCSRCVEQDAVIKVQRISASILLNQVLCDIKGDWLKHEPRSTCLLVWDQTDIMGTTTRTTQVLRRRRIWSGCEGMLGSTVRAYSGRWWCTCTVPCRGWVVGSTVHVVGDVAEFARLHCTISDTVSDNVEWLLSVRESHCIVSSHASFVVVTSPRHESRRDDVTTAHPHVPYVGWLQ